MINAYSPYTAIVARPWIHALEVVSSTLHQKVKYPSRGQVEEIRGDQVMARQCMVAAISCQSNAESSASENLQQPATSVGQVSEPAEEIKCESLEKFIVDNDPERFFQVGFELPPQEKEELVGFLRRNVDVFAWDAYDAPGVDPSLICHHLNVNPSSIPKKQPP